MPKSCALVRTAYADCRTSSQCRILQTGYRAALLMRTLRQEILGMPSFPLDSCRRHESLDTNSYCMVQASPVDFRRDIPSVENKILSGSSPRVLRRTRHPEAAPEAHPLYAPRTVGRCPLPAFPRGPFVVAGDASRGSRGRNPPRPGVGELRGTH